MLCSNSLNKVGLIGEHETDTWFLNSTKISTQEVDADYKKIKQTIPKPGKLAEVNNDGDVNFLEKVQTKK